MEYNFKSYHLIVIFLTLALSNLHTGRAFAGELTLKPSVASSVSVLNREFQEISQNESVVTLAPSLNTFYNSKRASLSMFLKHTVIARDGDSGSSSNNYTDVRLASQIALIENVLNLDVSTGQSYRARSQSQFDFSDRISAPNDLAKIQSDRAKLSFTLPNSPYVGLNLQSSISHTKSDSSVDEGRKVNGSNVLHAANIFNGHELHNFTYNFSARYNDTSRANFQDFKSTNLNGNVGLGLSNHFSIIVHGRLDDYDSESLSLSTSRRNLDTESYGAGFRWQPRDTQIIELTYNQLILNENKSRFVAVSTQWAFSKRTSMNFDYGKRFYGDAYTFDFKYKAKSLRASFGYNEEVTTFSRLSTTTQDIGIFVCTFGSSDLEDCFLPDSLEYVLQPGEEFRSLTEISSDISENVIFRKSGNISIGYQKRKLKGSLNVTRGTTEYLESNRETTRTRVSLNLGYTLGRRTNASLVTSISQGTSVNETNESRTFQTTLAVDRTIKQNLNAALSLRYAKRTRDDSTQDFVNSTINASLVYQF